jgi:uncharacterized repeat protein (TIGR01451 family)
VLNGSTVGLPEPNGCVQGLPAAVSPDAEACDLQGNHNGVLDAGDFPCSVTFSGSVAQAIAAANKLCDVGGGTTIGPDVTITKLDTPDPVAAGGELTYTIEVRNIGQVSAIGVAVRDELPAGTSFISCTSGQGTCTHSAGVVTAAIGSLGPGQAVTLTLKVRAPAAASCATIDNTATVTAVEDTDPTNNSASATTACVKPDVKIEKTDSPDPVHAGAELTYTIKVTNVSSVTASNVVVTDPLPAGTSFISCTSGQGTCTNGAGGVTANVGTMTSGQAVTITLKVKAPAAGSCSVINNTATVTATNDGDPSNNTASASTTCQAPDVKITKVDTPDPVVAGGEITYTITAQNIGAVDATNVVVTDTIPASTSFISCTTGQGTCTNNAGTVTATIGTLTPTQQVSITLKVRAPTGASCSTINNTATVKATDDANSSNNSATASTACKKPDVSVTKVDTPDPVVAGGTLTYTIAVKNVSEVNATNVVMTDVLPDGTSFVSCTTTQGSCTYGSGTVTGNAGTLTPGQTVTFTLKVTAPTGYKCGTFENTAKVTATTTPTRPTTRRRPRRRARSRTSRSRRSTPPTRWPRAGR